MDGTAPLLKMTGSKSFSLTPRKLQSLGTESCVGVLSSDVLPLELSRSEEFPDLARRLSLVAADPPNEVMSSFLNIKSCSSRYPGHLLPMRRHL